MANAIKGEVSLEHDGKSYTMVLDFNALADFEGETGKSAMAVLSDPDRMTVTEMRALFWAGLRQRQTAITLAEAGRILTANLDKLGDAMKAAFPEPKPGNGRGPGKAAR